MPNRHWRKRQARALVAGLAQERGFQSIMGNVRSHRHFMRLLRDGALRKLIDLYEHAMERMYDGDLPWFRDVGNWLQRSGFKKKNFEAVTEIEEYHDVIGRWWTS